MEEKPPICPKCKIRPRQKCNGVSKKYHTYCQECQKIISQDQWQNRKGANAQNVQTPQYLLCPGCQKNKRANGRKFCRSCSDQSDQVIIWGVIAAKIEDLVKYITKQAEFPPRIEKRAESRIKDGMSNLNFIITYMEDENGINKKHSKGSH